MAEVSGIGEIFENETDSPHEETMIDVVITSQTVFEDHSFGKY